MTTFYLARHGETEENLAQIFQGHLPGHLTEHGKEQARTLGQSLRDIRFDAFYSSDLRRTTDTADLLRAEAPQLPSYTPTSLLRERDWGEITGLPLSAVDVNHFPETVENVPALLARAEAFLHLLRTRHAGDTVLAMSHGLWCRAFDAVVSGRTIRETSRWQNCEARIYLL